MACGGGGGGGVKTCHLIFDSDWMLFEIFMKYIFYKNNSFSFHVFSSRFMNNFSVGGRGGGGGLNWDIHRPPKVFGQSCLPVVILHVQCFGIHISSLCRPIILIFSSI